MRNPNSCWLATMTNSYSQHLSKPCQKTAVVAGHFCLDILPSMDQVPKGEFFQLFTPGQLIETGKMQLATGGTASNTGISLTKLGIPTRIVAKVGDDAFGEIAQGIVNTIVSGENCQLIRSNDGSTSYTVIINPPGIDRIFLHHPGVNDTFVAADINGQHLAGAALLHYGYPQLMKRMYQHNGEEMLALFQKAKSLGLTTSMDTTMPDPSSEMGRVDWNTTLKKVLPSVDIYTPSFEEAFFMLEPEAYHRAKKAKLSDDDTKERVALRIVNKLLEYGANIVLLKMGEQGAMLGVSSTINQENIGNAWFEGMEDWSGKILWTPAFQVDVVGTTGAGDATVAGFIASLFHEMSAEQALTMAAAVGACNVEALDSTSGIRSWLSTVERVINGWEKGSVLPESEHWIWHPENQIWEYSSL
jgi:sugar/nucleoside kinase (ribokinase family)